MEVGGREKVMEEGITTTLPYLFYDKDKRIIQRKIIILNYKVITQR
jgi:hypothetical protein